MKAKKGFTLVEILIVVVILGILAAIVIPQFTDAATQANESRLKSDLQMLRSQVELYKVQHNDALPGSQGVDFPTAMLSYTNLAGVVQAGPGNGVFGPYMQAIPTNPFNNSDVVTEATPDPGAAGGAGWFFNTSTGQIRPDDDKTSPDGVAHIAL